MKIAYYYPSQAIVAKDILFCKYTGYDFLHQRCDSGVDVIYAGSVSVLPQAMAAKQMTGKPLICWVWDIPYNWKEWDLSEEGMKKNASRDIANKQRVDLLKQCDMIMCGSKWTQNVLKDQYGLSSEQMYFYIDMESIDAVPAQKRVKQITQISRYFYNKKFEHTIMSARDLADYMTVFIGAGSRSSYAKSLRELSDEYNKNVIFNDILSRHEVITNIKKATVLVSPSVFEGWGMTPLEAVYCKTPILLSDLEVFEEVYGDKVIYHKRNDVDDMKEKLERLVGDETLRQAIVKDCQPLLADLTPEKFAERWTKIVN